MTRPSRTLGDANYLPVASTTPTVVNVLGPFSVTANNGIVIANPGQSGSGSLTISSNGGFSGDVTLTCTPDPHATEAGCTLTNGSTSGQSIQVSLNSAGQANLTVNVTTAGPHPRAIVMLSVPGGLALVALILIFPAGKRRRRALLSAMTVILGLGLAACGGGSSGGGGGGGGNTDPGTPIGLYTFTVVGTSGSGSSATSISTPVTVTVH